MVKKEKLCGNPNYIITKQIIGKGAEGEIYPICITESGACMKNGSACMKDKNKENCDGFVVKVMDSVSKSDKERNNKEIANLTKASSIGIGPELNLTATCNGKLYIVMEKLDTDIRTYFYNILKKILEDPNITYDKIKHYLVPRINNIIKKIKDLHRIAKLHDFKIYDIHAGNYMGRLDTKTDKFIWKRIDFGGEENFLKQIDEQLSIIVEETVKHKQNEPANKKISKLKHDEIIKNEKNKIINNFTNVFDFQQIVYDLGEEIPKMMSERVYKYINEDELLAYLSGLFPRDVELVSASISKSNDKKSSSLKPLDSKNKVKKSKDSTSSNKISILKIKSKSKSKSKSDKSSSITKKIS
jgi:hypothetical protein